MKTKSFLYLIMCFCILSTEYSNAAFPEPWRKKFNLDEYQNPENPVNNLRYFQLADEYSPYGYPNSTFEIEFPRVFLTYYYADKTKIGLALGVMKRKGIGAFFGVRGSIPILTNTAYEVNENRVLQNVANDSILLTNHQFGRLSAVVGINFSIIPGFLFGYTAAGVALDKEIWDIDIYYKGEMQDRSIAKNTLNSYMGVAGNAGLIMNIGPITLHGGIATSYAGKDFKYYEYTLGAGFSW